MKITTKWSWIVFFLHIILNWFTSKMYRVNVLIKTMYWFFESSFLIMIFLSLHLHHYVWNWVIRFIDMSICKDFILKSVYKNSVKIFDLKKLLFFRFNVLSLWFHFIADQKVMKVSVEGVDLLEDFNFCTTLLLHLFGINDFFQAHKMSPVFFV